MEAAIPVAALAAGFLLALLMDWVRDGAAVRRERKRLAAEAQRETLIQLQEALLQLGRAAGSLHTARKRRFDDRREWLASEEFFVHFETLTEARMGLITLASRVDDPGLRSAITTLRQHEAILAAAAAPAEAVEAYARMSDDLVAAVERSGDLIRQA